MSRLLARRRSAPAALAAVIVALAAAAPWLAPRPPDLQEDVAGARYLPPLARAFALQTRPGRVRIVTDLRRGSGGWSYLRAGRREELADGDLVAPPSPRQYLLGTDALGRDLAGRLLYGTRHSLAIASLAVALALLLGVGVGSAAAVAGGRWDALIMRGVDVLMSIPRLLMVLLCAALFRPSTFLLVLILGATTWTGLARIVRGEMLALRGGDLELAARALGAPPARTILRHLVPQIIPVLVVGASLRLADTVLLESAVSLLGFGSPSPAVSLGGIMASGREALAEAWWIAAWPGLLLCVLVLTLRSAAASIFRTSDPPSVA